MSCGNTLKMATKMSAKLRWTINHCIRVIFCFRARRTTRTKTLPKSARYRITDWTAISTLASSSSRLKALLVRFVELLTSPELAVAIS